MRPGPQKPVVGGRSCRNVGILADAISAGVCVCVCELRTANVVSEVLQTWEKAF